jgi:hypothetical protein
VTVEVAGAAAPPPPKKKFPMWVIFVIIGVVVIVGVVVLILAFTGNGNGNSEPSPTPVEATPTPVEATPTPTPAQATPTATPPDGNQFRVIGTTLVANPDSYNGRCPAKITFSGSITVNKAGRVKYTFVRSDGARGTRDLSLDFNGPGSKTVETTWNLGAATPTFQPFRGFQRIKILSPNEMESNRAVFVLQCR